MRSKTFGVPLLLSILVFVASCSQDQDLGSPEHLSDSAENKNGTETLGDLDVNVSSASGFVEGGVGMVGQTEGTLSFDVPVGATISQVFLYWAGGTTVVDGDDSITLAGQTVEGTLIGGPVNFFSADGIYYYFSSYRADVTSLGLVGDGNNTLTVGDFQFDMTAGVLDENNGCSIVVLYDDGTDAEVGLVDGIDMAFFGFSETLDATVPQTFSFTASTDAREAELLLVVGSVGENRPSQILVTTSAGTNDYTDFLGSFDGLTWDSLTIPVGIAAGETELTVQLVSTNSENPLGASMAWVCAGLATPLPAPPNALLSGTVYVDADSDGQQASYESGIGNVVLDIVNAQGVLQNVTTDADGNFEFAGLAGDYTVSIDVNNHLDTFNDDLGASFDPTTPVSVSVTAPQANVAFGYVPLPDQIIADLDFGVLSAISRPGSYWTKLFRRGLIEENSNRTANGHGGDSTDSGGWGHDENYLSASQLHLALDTIAQLYQPEPYVFTEGNELREVYELLKSKPKTDKELLFRELLITELNFVTSLGLIAEDDRLAVLISWGETLLVTPIVGGFNKAGEPNFRDAYRLFDTVNTGGGAGVDE
ncbi:MAG: hypothetical protein ACI9UK_000137 [Candidatus Krumholzibacteriia bacterium]|jgi:hypothetical protein